MHRSPAEPKPAAARWSAAKSRSASGSTIAWFFAPPSACTRLPVARGPLVDVPGDRRRADERHRGDVRVVEDRVDRHLVAVHHVEDAVRQAGLRPQLGRPSSDADGSRSLGLSTKVLPQAIATGCIHIGTITGKLNGVMPATHPERLAEASRVDAGGDLVGVLALEQRAGCRRRTRRPPGRAAPRRAASESTLPCSSETISASSSTCAFDQLAEGEHDLACGVLSDACARPRTPPWPPRTAASTSAGSASTHLGLLLARSPGSRPAPRRVDGAGGGAAADPVLDRSSCGCRPLAVTGTAAGPRLAASYAVAGLPGACPASDTSATGTSHQALAATAPAPAGRSRRARRSCRRRAPWPAASAPGSSSTVRHRSTSAPRLAALAARSTGSTSPSQPAGAGVAVAVAGAEPLRAERLRQRADRGEAVVLHQHHDQLDALGDGGDELLRHHQVRAVADQHEHLAVRVRPSCTPSPPAIS